MTAIGLLTTKVFAKAGLINVHQNGKSSNRLYPYSITSVYLKDDYRWFNDLNSCLSKYSGLIIE
jgi:hypothetical protein